MVVQDCFKDERRGLNDERLAVDEDDVVIVVVVRRVDFHSLVSTRAVSGIHFNDGKERFRQTKSGKSHSKQARRYANTSI